MAMMFDGLYAQDETTAAPATSTKAGAVDVYSHMITPGLMLVPLVFVRMLFFGANNAIF